MHIKPDLISEKFLPCVYLVSSTLSMTLSVTARMTPLVLGVDVVEAEQVQQPVTGEEAQLTLVGVTVLLRLQSARAGRRS